MRNTRKILVALLVLMTILTSLAVVAIPASAAAQPEKLYLTPSSNWKQSNARFAAYFFGNGDKWVSMTDANKDGVYEVDVPTDKVYPSVIFCRMNPSATANNWNNKWNQTSDLTIPTSGANHYTVKEGTWDKGGGTWSTFGSTCAHANLGPAATCTTAQKCLDCGDPVVSELGHAYNTNHLCTRCNQQATFVIAGDGSHLGGDFNPALTANNMTYDAETGVYTKVYTNVAKGSYKFKCVRDNDTGWGTAYPSADKTYTVATSGSTVTMTLKGTTVNVTVEVPHTCSFVAGEVVPPTFEADGYTVYSCTCGKTENRDVVPALVAVAQVGEVKYTDLQEAIKAAAPAGTVELLSDVTVEKWIMIAENLNIADGSLITLTVDGMTIDGNDHALTVNSIESAGNGGYLFHGVSNLNVQDLTIKIAEGCVGGISLKSGNITNVTFDGGESAVMPGAGEVKIEGCTFKTNGHAVYYEEARDNLVVNNCTFELASDANVILLRGAEQFTNNTVVSGRTVNVVSGSPVVSGNNFGDVRVKVYNTATATISNNTINNLVFNDETVAGSTFADNTLSESAQTALEAVLAPPHTHVWSDATCTEPQKCECGETQGEALGHTPGAAANCTTAQTCTVCGAELVAKLGHVDADLDINCDREGCTSKVAPPADSVLSNFTANQLGSLLSTSSKYYVVGKIVEVLDQKNGIFLVDDGTGEKFYFRLPKNADGVAHSSWEIKLTEGDKVQIYGAINKYSTSSAPNGQYWPAMQGPVVTVLEQHAHVANGEPVCTKDTLCACGALVATATGHVDADNNGLCDNCNWDMNLVEVYIAIGTDPKYNGVRVDDEAGKALSWTWSNGGFDAIISKGTSTVTLYTTAKDYMQLKKQNLLTIVNTEDVTVKYITISVTSESYLNTLKTAIGTQYEFTADATNFTVTIQLNSTEDFVLENKSTSTVYVNGVSIVYAKKGAHVHEFKETITTPATCTEAGVKTFACECGEGTYTEAIEALGHDFVKGVCTRCEEKDPTYCAHKDTGLDAKCDLCGKWFLPESPFKLEMYQATKKETYYFTGSMSGYYFATSTDITKAVDLYAEEVDGGYNVYFMSGSTKNYLYIELSGTHINAKFGSTKAVWYVDPTYGCLTTEVSGAKYFLGTYSTYVTFGGTAYSRLNDSTADVSQYIGRAVSLEAHECTNTTSNVTAPTCTAQGYTTFKCADCGLSTKGEYVDALGHDMITDEAVAPTCTATGLTEGSHCSRCDHKVAQEEVPALGHTAGAEATCTTAQTCTVCNAELVAALGHDMMTHTETLPTCTETGLTAGAECSRCDHKTGLEEIPALGHDYAEGQCTRCGEKDLDYKPEEKPEDKPEEKPEEKPEDKPEEKPEDETPDEEPTPDVELSIFDKIMKTINELIAKLTAWFKNLFAGLKK